MSHSGTVGDALLGVDIGGTSTRAVLCTPGGAVLAAATAGGGNPRSNPGQASDRLPEVLQALRTTDARVAGVAVGAAGGGHPSVREMVQQTVVSSGLDAPLAVVPDIDIAFRAGGVGGDGVLLLAGTGAIAARYRDHAMMQRCDGMGWLLGDLGSGVWLGQQVLRAAAAHLDDRGPATSLTAAVLRHATPTGDDHEDPRQQLIAMAHQLSPAGMGSFAHLALEHGFRQDTSRLGGAAKDGEAGDDGTRADHAPRGHAADDPIPDDPVARDIVRRAAEHLVASATTVGATPGRPVVLSGGLLSAGPLAGLVRDSFPGSAHVAHPVVGACALAADLAGIRLDVRRLADSLLAQASVAAS